jgi:hypothetical protein
MKAQEPPRRRWFQKSRLTSGTFVAQVPTRVPLVGGSGAGVLDGVPDHRDVVLSTAERAAGDAILPCVSRACGRRLVLDL